MAKIATAISTSTRVKAAAARLRRERGAVFALLRRDKVRRGLGVAESEEFGVRAFTLDS